MIKVVLIGSGNVASHLLHAFQKSTAIELVQVLARNPSKINTNIEASKITSNFKEIAAADVYIIAVSDNAIAEVAQNLPFKNRLVVHTSGSSEMELLGNHNRKGVFYPLQTFSADKAVDFLSVPFCLETEYQDDYAILEKLALSLSKKVYPISSAQRKSLHIAAVFVCNFVNQLYQIGNQICDDNKVPFEILHPLIKETAQKVLNLSPKDAQTGPAVRNDTITIKKHVDFLENPAYKALYISLTESIQNVKKL